ncbi:hypothetical protein ABT160_37580 [Streptomyces sp. NPDC001941]|uniref:hypothetical protein n=1 Tax=Streptomyces sp. NPDC001941 TaxID=3154659 RepID=UPI003319AA91
MTRTRSVLAAALLFATAAVGAAAGPAMADNHMPSPPSGRPAITVQDNHMPASPADNSLCC